MAHDSINSGPTHPSHSADEDRYQLFAWIAIGTFIVILIAAYANSFERVLREWKTPEYSHGYLIPAFAAALLWLRRDLFDRDFPNWERWVGVGVLALGILIRVFAARTVRPIIDDASFIPCVLGIFIMVGGVKVVRWAGPPICFLAFMYPLPGVLRDSILRPLQSVATKFSVYAMQTLGVETYADGNVIHLEAMEMNVVDACSGLRMLTILLALAVAMVMVLSNRPWWERLAILISAGPVALLVNVIRITITGLMYNMNIGSEIVDKFFHDFAGYIMMPMALGFLYLEVTVLSKLLIETDERPGQVGLGPKSIHA